MVYSSTPDEGLIIIIIIIIIIITTVAEAEKVGWWMRTTKGEGSGSREVSPADNLNIADLNAKKNNIKYESSGNTSKKEINKKGAPVHLYFIIQYNKVY